MGISTNVLQEALGHADLATTEAYLDYFEDKVVDEANESIVT
jgi:site-specific recombinase XerD